MLRKKGLLAFVALETKAYIQTCDHKRMKNHRIDGILFNTLQPHQLKLFYVLSLFACTSTLPYILDEYKCYVCCVVMHKPCTIT